MLTYEEFLRWAKERESFNDSPSYVKECFDYALKQVESIAYYFAPFQRVALVKVLALHYIILTPSDENLELHLKYFPNDNDKTNSNLLSVIGSTSNSTSSISNIAFKGLQDLSIQDALLLGTPYGTQALGLLESLRFGIVLV